ncbi:putative gpi anchored protein [Venturia nashicola]|nr:putative gpi anchored protein [Venturia nashicola]
MAFNGDILFDRLSYVFNNLESSYIITSHAGCNDEGARVPFLITAVSFSKSDKIFWLEVEEKPWNVVPGKITIEYGHTAEHHELRRHAVLGKRQQASSTSSVPSIATSLIPSGTPTETSSSKVLNLAYESKPDTKFSFPPGLGPSAPLEIGCKLCKTTGNLKVTRGEFSLISMDDIDFIGDNITSPLDYITSGSMDLELNDFTALVNLQITPSLSGDLNYTLYPVPIFGFSIPNIGKAGLLYDPQIKLSWELKNALSFSYGFDLSIPGCSRISIDLVNANESSVAGFSKASIKPIPLQANVSDIELSMSLGLQSAITVGFGFFADAILAEASAYVDHPSEKITITQLSTANTDANCESADGAPLSEANFNQVYSNLTYISTEASLSAGLDVTIGAMLPPLSDKAFVWDTVLTEISLPQHTACLVYQESKDSTTGGSFATASSVFAEMKALASSSSPAVAASSASASALRDNLSAIVKRSRATRLPGRRSA